MNILWLPSIDSTNSEAFRRLAELPSGTILAAYEQTAGRGQRGNTWFTEPGKNLTFSIVLKFSNGQLAAPQAHWLNYLMSHVVARFLEDCGVPCQIKWPNDVYVRRRKICGILIENTLQGPWLDAAVIGVGININQRTFPQLSNATSLFCCTGKEFPLEESLEQVAALFEEALPALFDAALRERLFAHYSGSLFQKDIPARYRDLLREMEFTGIIEGVEPDGRLCILDQEAGQRRYYQFKEVSYIL